MSIRIGAKQNVEGLRDRLCSQFALLPDLKVHLVEQGEGEFTFFSCKAQDNGTEAGSLTQPVFKRYLANVLAEIILNEWEKALIDRELKLHHQGLSDDERQAITEKTVKVLNNIGNGLGQSTYRCSRKTRIVQKVLEYLEINDQLILEGFIRFRLKEYYAELQAAITTAVDEFMLEKEYLEFIRLLRYFVDIQEPKIDTLHVLVKKTGGFQLYDDNYTLVSSDYLEGFVVDLVDNEITYEDLLLSALITIAPRLVVLHLPQYKESETIKTIRNVFGERVSNCQGCQLCSAASKS